MASGRRAPGPPGRRRPPRAAAESLSPGTRWCGEQFVAVMAVMGDSKFVKPETMVEGRGEEGRGGAGEAMRGNGEEDGMVWYGAIWYTLIRYNSQEEKEGLQMAVRVRRKGRCYPRNIMRTGHPRSKRKTSSSLNSTKSSRLQIARSRSCRSRTSEQKIFLRVCRQDQTLEAKRQADMYKSDRDGLLIQVTTRCWTSSFINLYCRSKILSRSLSLHRQKTGVRGRSSFGNRSLPRLSPLSISLLPPLLSSPFLVSHYPPSPFCTSSAPYLTLLMPLLPFLSSAPPSLRRLQEAEDKINELTEELTSVR
eukprot:767835-Hanusia_phi.AAC.4